MIVIMIRVCWGSHGVERQRVDLDPHDKHVQPSRYAGEDSSTTGGCPKSTNNTRVGAKGGAILVCNAVVPASSGSASSRSIEWHSVPNTAPAHSGHVGWIM